MNFIAHTDEKSILSGNTKRLESQCHYEEAIALMQKTGRYSDGEKTAFMFSLVKWKTGR